MLNVKVVNTKTGQDGKDLSELKGVTVPIRVSGPFDKLGYQVQWKEIGSKAVKEAVKGGLIDLLSNQIRSEEHTSALQSLMRNSYAVFCLKKKTKYKHLRET